MKEEVQRDGRADHFREVAGGDREFAEDPQAERHRPGIVVAAGLGQVASGRDAELRAQRWSRTAIRFEMRMTLSSV